MHSEHHVQSRCLSYNKPQCFSQPLYIGQRDPQGNGNVPHGRGGVQLLGQIDAFFGMCKWDICIAVHYGTLGVVRMVIVVTLISE